MKTLFVAILTIAAVLAANPMPRVEAQIGVPAGAKVDPMLTSYFATHAGTSVATVVSYRQMPTSSDLTFLQSIGIVKGFKLRELPMVIADVNALQLAALRQRPNVSSVYGNRTLSLFTNTSRKFIGLDGLIADAEIRAANPSNPGIAVSGRGVGIGYVDTGIDGTHQDLVYGTDRKTVQNVLQPFSEMTVGDGGLAVGVGLNIADVLYESAGFYAPVYVANQPHTDVESGHGTHGAAVAAGTGEMSGGLYGGVAEGAHLVGVNSGNELGLPLVAILGAYDYLLTNQAAYNIRVINNSWGSTLDPSGIDTANPINIATRKAHDRNIVVVFAAGNAGDTPTSINPYSTMPWVISVAAGEKQGLGTPADFSSRGVDDGTGVDVAGQPADPNAPPNLRPDITAPGVDIKSARMKGPGITNTAGTVPLLGNDLTTIPPAFLPFYTTSQGTSFACPHVSGVVALMLEANPLLTPDEVVTVIRQSANPMPYPERVVGAGYVDVHNAVRGAMGMTSVAHAFNLFPVAGGTEIVDASGDHFGTDAQDILSADFSFDPVTNQLVYTMELVDPSVRTPNMRWTMTSRFGNTDVFVTASQNETVLLFEYGRITTLATGTQNQETVGLADTGYVIGNKIVVRLALSKLNEAALGNVYGTTSTGTQAQAQILIGTSVSGGLLLNSDSAAGSDFVVGP